VSRDLLLAYSPGVAGADLLAYAIHNRLTPFISMQNQHNAMYREEEREMMPMLKYYGVGTVPWGPIAAGCEFFSSMPFVSDLLIVL
jgi:aryl-alcohol dehydrogenase-like predicted oxidoreductase